MPTISATRAVLREEMPITAQWTFLDHASVAPIPDSSRRAIRCWLEQATEQGSTVWGAWHEDVEALRCTAADLVGAHTDEIALVPSTTAGISLVAEGMPWRRGDNVVTLTDEFPSNVYPWMNLADRGVETRRVPTHGGIVDLARLDDACDAATRVVSVSWIGYASGCRQDLTSIAELAHRHGALLFVDAIQGLGVFPLDVSRTPIDFFAADGHKWMLGPEGAGIFYIRRPHLDLLRPFGVGWHSVVHDHDFSHIDLKLKRSAARYEGGTQNMVGMIGLGASLSLLMQLGLEHVAECVLETGDLAIERLEQLGAEIVSPRERSHRSGIVSFRLPEHSPAAVRRQCLERKVALSARSGCLRISPHAYNDAHDIDQLINALEAVASH